MNNENKVTTFIPYDLARFFSEEELYWRIKAAIVFKNIPKESLLEVNYTANKEELLGFSIAYESIFRRTPKIKPEYPDFFKQIINEGQLSIPLYVIGGAWFFALSGLAIYTTLIIFTILKFYSLATIYLPITLGLSTLFSAALSSILFSSSEKTFTLNKPLIEHCFDTLRDAQKRLEDEDMTNIWHHKGFFQRPVPNPDPLKAEINGIIEGESKLFSSMSSSPLFRHRRASGSGEGALSVAGGTGVGSCGYIRMEGEGSA